MHHQRPAAKRNLPTKQALRKHSFNRRLPRPHRRAPCILVRHEDNDDAVGAVALDLGGAGVAAGTGLVDNTAVTPGLAFVVGDGVLDAEGAVAGCLEDDDEGLAAAGDT